MDETDKAVKAAMTQHAKIVTGEDKEKQNKCMDEIKKVLQDHNCILVPRAILSPGNAEFMIECRTRPKGMPDQPQLANPFAAQLKQEAEEEKIVEPEL